MPLVLRHAPLSACSISRTTLGPHKPVVLAIPIVYLVSSGC